MAGTDDTPKQEPQRIDPARNEGHRQLDEGARRGSEDRRADPKRQRTLVEARESADARTLMDEDDIEVVERHILRALRGVSASLNDGSLRPAS